MGIDRQLYRLREKALQGSYLAQMRDRAHKAFDPIWQSGLKTRTGAYDWLGERLGIPPQYRATYCHFGMFDIVTCVRVIEICTPLARQCMMVEVTEKQYEDLC